MSANFSKQTFETFSFLQKQKYIFSQIQFLWNLKIQRTNVFCEKYKESKISSKLYFGDILKKLKITCNKVIQPMRDISVLPNIRIQMIQDPFAIILNTNWKTNSPTSLSLWLVDTGIRFRSPSSPRPTTFSCSRSDDRYIRLRPDPSPSSFPDAGFNLDFRSWTFLV